MSLDALFDRMNLGNTTINDVANHFAMIELVHTTMVVLCLMNLFGRRGYAGRLDEWWLHNRSRPRHFRWMMVPLECCLANLAVHTGRVLAPSDVLHEPTFGCNLQPSVCSSHIFEVVFFDATGFQI